MALRDPEVVIGSMLAVEGLPDDLRRRLERIRKYDFYRAPEERLTVFREIQDALSYHVPQPPEEPWHVRVVAAWMNLTEAQVLEQFGGPLAPRKTREEVDGPTVQGTSEDQAQGGPEEGQGDEAGRVPEAV